MSAKLFENQVTYKQLIYKSYRKTGFGMRRMEIYISMLWLIMFYGIWTLLGYLMLNPVYACIKYLNFNEKFIDNIFKWAKGHLFA